MSQPELLTKLFENDGAGPNLRSDIIPETASSSSERYTEVSWGGVEEETDDGVVCVPHTMVVPPDASKLVVCCLDIVDFTGPDDIENEVYILIYTHGDPDSIADIDDLTSISFGTKATHGGHQMYANPDTVDGESPNGNSIYWQEFVPISLDKYAGKACVLCVKRVGGNASVSDFTAYARVRLYY